MSQPWHAAYPAELCATVSYPDIPLWGLLEQNARHRPDKRALISGTQTWSYRQLWSDALQAAAGLAIQPGDRVLLWLPNQAEFVTSYYGALRAGAVISAASPALAPAQLLAQIADTDPAVVIVTADRIAELSDLEGTRVQPPEWTDQATPPAAAPIDSATTVAVLQYTSGTTGQAKGAMMSHRNLVANALQNARWFGWSDDEVTLGILPLCHTWGMCCCLNSTVAVGGTLVLDPDQPHFEPERVFELVERHGCTVLYGSGTMFQRLLSCPTRDATRLKTLRHVKAGAMLSQGQLKQRWDTFCPTAPLQQGYGLTEASPESHNNPPQRFRQGTVGVPVQDTECRITDPVDPARILPAGQPGEVRLRGPQIMLGYWRQPAATATALVDGWLRTGDVGVMDEDGYLTIVDRMKDLLKFRGYSISPNTVEECLLEHPAVREAVVVGRPDEIDGEIPTAFIVSEEAVAMKNLIAHCREQLASYEVPREIHVVPEIPKNLVGKPLRRLIRERLASTPPPAT